MTNPITPPPELVEQLRHSPSTWLKQITIAYQAGAEKAQALADQELEACCEWLRQSNSDWEIPRSLRAARRPKPPSLKRVALLQLDTLNADLGLEGKGVDLSQIRRALEALDD